MDLVWPFSAVIWSVSWVIAQVLPIIYRLVPGLHTFFYKFMGWNYLNLRRAPKRLGLCMLWLRYLCNPKLQNYIFPASLVIHLPPSTTSVERDDYSALQYWPYPCAIFSSIPFLENAQKMQSKLLLSNATWISRKNVFSKDLVIIDVKFCSVLVTDFSGCMKINI